MSTLKPGFCQDPVYIFIYHNVPMLACKMCTVQECRYSNKISQGYCISYCGPFIKTDLRDLKILKPISNGFSLEF